MIMTVQLSTVFSARKLHLIISCKMAPVLDLPVMTVLIPHIFCKGLKTWYRKDTGYEIRFYFTPYSQKSHGYEAITTFFCKSLPDHTRCYGKKTKRYQQRNQAARGNQCVLSNYIHADQSQDQEKLIRDCGKYKRSSFRNKHVLFWADIGNLKDAITRLMISIKFQSRRAFMKNATAFLSEGRESYTTVCCSLVKLPQKCWTAHPIYSKTLAQCLVSKGLHRTNLFCLFPEMSFLPRQVHLADYRISWIISPFIRIKVLYRSCFVYVTELSDILVCGLPGPHPMSLSPSDSSFNSHFHRLFWRAYSEIFRSFYECKECGGEPQDSPTYSSPFQLPAACQILINEKVASSYSCWFSLFLSGEFLNRIQSIEPTLSLFSMFFLTVVSEKCYWWWVSAPRAQLILNSVCQL